MTAPPRHANPPTSASSWPPSTALLAALALLLTSACGDDARHQRDTLTPPDTSSDAAHVDLDATPGDDLPTPGDTADSEPAPMSDVADGEHDLEPTDADEALHPLDATDDADPGSHPLPPPAACEPPALSLGDLAVAHDASLALLPARTDGPQRTALATSSPLSAPVAAFTTSGSAELFVAEARPDACALHGLRRAVPEGPDTPPTAERWLLAEPAPSPLHCASPTPIPKTRRALWPVGSQLLEVDLDAGLETRRLSLPDTATTALVPVSPGALVAGGGSHWLVGMGPRLALVSRTEVGLTLGPTLTVPAPRELTALAPVDDLLVAYVARGAEPGFGSTLGLASITFEGVTPTAITPFGEPLEVPSTVLAHPVTLGCDAVAGGGSHWFCPGGLLVAAGDGWARAWQLPSGVEAWTHFDTLRYTGLTAAGDGRVAGGGSHWLPSPDPTDPLPPIAGGWELRVLGPDGPPTTLSSGAQTSTCVPSPIIDGDGLVVAAVLGATPELTRTPSDLPPLASGWSRPGGSATNAAVPDTGACADGAPRGLARLRLQGRVPLVHRSNGALSAVAGATDDGRPWFAWLEADGSVRQEVIPLAAGATTGSPIHALTLRMKLAFVAFTQPAPLDQTNLVVSEWLRGATAPTQEHVVGISADTLVVGIDTDLADEIVVLLELPGALTFQRFGAEPLDGPVITTAPFGTTGFGDGPADGHLAWGQDLDAPSSGFVRVFGPALSQRALIPLSRPDYTLTVVDARPTPSGEVLVLVNHSPTRGGLAEARLERFSAEGVALASLALGPPLARALEVHPSGLALVLDEALHTRRVGPGDTLGPRRPLAALTALGLAPDALSLELGAGYLAFARTDDPPTAALVHLDTEGFSTCAEVGHCLGQPACVSADPCLSSGCDPTSGTCVDAPLDTPSCNPP